MVASRTAPKTPRLGSLVGDLKPASLTSSEADQWAARVTRSNTRATNRLLLQRNATLILHAAELAKSNRRLEREVVRRKAAELVKFKDGERYHALFLESQVMQRKLRQLTRQIIAAQEEERRQISRELHDDVVQTLVAINVQLSMLSHGAVVNISQLRSRIVRTQRAVGKSIETVHRFARELRPAVLDDLGLIPALLAYCEVFAVRKNLKIQLTASAAVDTLDEAQRTALFRVAQEALTNVTRHAKATRVDIVITCVNGTTRLEIRDNGKAAQVAKVLNRPTTRLGLLGMKERMEMVGGTLGFAATARSGATVIAEIPARRKPSAK